MFNVKKGNLIEYKLHFLNEKHVCIVLKIEKDYNFGKILHVLQEGNKYFVPLMQIENIKVLNEHKNTNSK